MRERKQSGGRLRVPWAQRRTEPLTGLQHGWPSSVGALPPRTLTWVQGISAVRRIYWCSSGHRE